MVNKLVYGSKWNVLIDGFWTGGDLLLGSTNVVCRTDQITRLVIGNCLNNENMGKTKLSKFKSMLALWNTT